MARLLASTTVTCIDCLRQISSPWTCATVPATPSVFEGTVQFNVDVDGRNAVATQDELDCLLIPTFETLDMKELAQYIVWKAPEPTRCWVEAAITDPFANPAEYMAAADPDDQRKVVYMREIDESDAVETAICDIDVEGGDIRVASLSEATLDKKRRKRYVGSGKGKKGFKGRNGTHHKKPTQPIQNRIDYSSALPLAESLNDPDRCRRNRQATPFTS